MHNLPSVIKLISKLYIIYGVSLVIACFLNAKILNQQLSYIDAFIPFLLIISSIGVLLLKNWGRIIILGFSCLFIIGVPIGTIIGYLMVKHLIRHKYLFLK